MATAIDIQVSANKCPADYYDVEQSPQKFDLQPGDTVWISATGTWLTHPHGPDTPWNGAGGNGVPNHGTYYCAGSESCMVIMSGPVPPPYPSQLTVWGWFKDDYDAFTLSNPSGAAVRYYFFANDDYSNNCSAYADNQGIITIHVQPGPVPLSELIAEVESIPLLGPIE